MAKYLRPRRGSMANAQAQNFVLKSGEMFLEYPSGSIGKGPGRIMIGDGSSSYSAARYVSTVSTDFRPFITDPSIYIPVFPNSTVPTSGQSVVTEAALLNSSTFNGSASTASATLPTIIGSIKKVLCSHDQSITKLNNDLAVDGFTMKNGSSYTYIYPGRVETSNSSNGKFASIHSMDSNTDYGPNITLYGGSDVGRMTITPTDISLAGADTYEQTNYWGGFNENSLNDTISAIYTRLTTWTTLGNISSPTTTATIFNLDSGCKFSDYAFLFIRAGHYSNWYETLMISSNSFKYTNAGYKVIMNLRVGGTDVDFCMYYKSDTSLYAYATGTHASNTDVTIYGLGKY